MSEELFKNLIKIILDKSLKNNKITHNTELFIITLKSLFPSSEEVKVYIDYNRYNKEFILWKYYKESSNQVLDNIKRDIDGNIYFNGEDDSIIYRLLPLIFTNTDFDCLRDEVIKNILYTTGNIKNIIENLLISKLLFLILNGYANIKESLTEEIISLNQMEFKERYFKYFRLEPIEDSKYSIEIEKTKIEFINILNNIKSNKIKNFERYYGLYMENIDKNREDILKSICINLDENIYIENNIKYFEELGKYLYNMRKSRIDPKALYISEYTLPNIFDFEKGEIFYHSLLNNCVVMEKESGDNYIYSKIKTKSGIYNFKKSLANN